VGRLRSIAVGVSLLIAGAWPLVAGTEPVCATTGPQAALVIDDGSATVELCIALDAAAVSGTHLIELAHAQHDLTYALGFGEQAVCMLNGVGPTGGDCFAEYPDYWGYWHGDGHGGWTWGSSGAATFEVRDGAIEGWAFGSGDSGSTHAQPPAITTDDVCGGTSHPPVTATPTPNPEANGNGQVGGDTPSDEGGVGGTGEEPGGGSTGTPTDQPRFGPSGASPDGHGPRAGVPRLPGGGPPGSTPVSASPDGGDVRAAASGGDDGRAGPPAGMFVAIAVGALLGAGGWWRLRTARQHGRPQ
jgi:hypothetical protein